MDFKQAAVFKISFQLKHLFNKNTFIEINKTPSQKSIVLHYSVDVIKSNKGNGWL